MDTKRIVLKSKNEEYRLLEIPDTYDELTAFIMLRY
jgi:hypothetical protein